MPDPQPPSSPLKPVDTTALLLAVLGLVKELGSIFALAMMEWARIKQHKAEDKAAVAVTELQVEKAKNAVVLYNVQKDPRDVIDDFLSK